MAAPTNRGRIRGGTPAAPAIVSASQEAINAPAYNANGVITVRGHPVFESGRHIASNHPATSAHASNSAPRGGAVAARGGASNDGTPAPGPGRHIVTATIASAAALPGSETSGDAIAPAMHQA